MLKFFINFHSRHNKKNWKEKLFVLTSCVPQTTTVEQSRGLTTPLQERQIRPPCKPKLWIEQGVGLECWGEKVESYLEIVDFVKWMQRIILPWDILKHMQNIRMTWINVNIVGSSRDKKLSYNLNEYHFVSLYAIYNTITFRSFFFYGHWGQLYIRICEQIGQECQKHLFLKYLIWKHGFWKSTELFFSHVND